MPYILASIVLTLSVETQIQVVLPENSKVHTVQLPRVIEVHMHLPAISEVRARLPAVSEVHTHLPEVKRVHAPLPMVNEVQI